MFLIISVFVFLGRPIVVKFGSNSYISVSQAVAAFFMQMISIAFNILFLYEKERKGPLLHLVSLFVLMINRVVAT